MSLALIKVNGNVVNIPSYLVNVGDIISSNKQYLDEHANFIFSARSASE